MGIMRYGLGLLLFLLLMAIAPLPLSAASGSSVIAVAKSPSRDAQRRLNEVFYRWQTYEIDLVELHRKAKLTGRLQLQAEERVFDLELEPNDLRDPGFRQILQTSRGPVPQKQTEVATFKGRLAGDPGSIVRLLILPNLLQGYIKTEEEWLFFDPLFKYAKGAPTSQVVVFDEEDVRPEAASHCGSGGLASTVSSLHSISGESLHSISAASTLRRRLSVATEADYEYYSIYGANANSQIQGVINQVDGIYQTDHSITLRIVYQSVWTTTSDPYVASDSLTLLYEFRDYWNAYRSNVGRDTAHLFTGRVMDRGSIIGRAWLSVVCNSPNLAYGVSGDYWLMVKVVAHEIGHNLGAYHDDQVSPPASSCDGYGPIMCSWIQGSGPNSFSSRSKTDISTHVNQHCPPPVADFSWSHYYGTTVNFDASSSYDTNGYIVDYLWDFGDGYGGGYYGVNPSYTYSNEGCYDVTLTVRDNQDLTSSTTRYPVVAGPYRICPP